MKGCNLLTEYQCTYITLSSFTTAPNQCLTLLLLHPSEWKHHTLLKLETWAHLWLSVFLSSYTSQLPSPHILSPDFFKNLSFPSITIFCPFQPIVITADTVHFLKHTFPLSFICLNYFKGTVLSSIPQIPNLLNVTYTSPCDISPAIFVSLSSLHSPSILGTG